MTIRTGTTYPHLFTLQAYSFQCLRSNLRSLLVAAQGWTISPFSVAINYIPTAIGPALQQGSNTSSTSHELHWTKRELLGPCIYRYFWFLPTKENLQNGIRTSIFYFFTKNWKLNLHQRSRTATMRITPRATPLQIYDNFAINVQYMKEITTLKNGKTYVKRIIIQTWRQNDKSR